MAQREKELESLHQQASAHYLQGEFDAALGVWRQMLTIDPENDRAQEGVRLCEMLSGTEAPNSAGGGADAAPSQPTAPTSVGFGIGEDLDESLDALDEMLDDGKSGDWMDADVAARHNVAPAAPADDLQFDLGDVPEADEVDRPATGGAGSIDAMAAELGLNRAGEPSAASVAAAKELEHRTNELMAEAMQLFERGERDEALAALDRVQILDESHAAARTFADHIRSEMGGGGEAVPSASIVGDDPQASDGDQLNHAPMDFEEFSEAHIALDPERGSSRTSPRAESFESLPEPKRPAASAPALTAGVPTARHAGTQRIVGVAALLLLVAGAGYLAWKFVGSSDEPAQAGAAEQATSLAGVPAAPAGAAGAAAAESDSGERVEGGQDVESLLAAARVAFEAGEYADAIVAYDRVVAADPENQEAQDRLRAAGEFYRAEREADERNRQAIVAFEQGDYRNALRLFYRMQPASAAEQRQIDGYKLNGWFNMGVQALGSGDCAMARSHLKEAQEIKPADAGVTNALKIAQECSAGPRQETYYDAVRKLPLRGLRD